MTEQAKHCKIMPESCSIISIMVTSRAVINQRNPWSAEAVKFDQKIDSFGGGGVQIKHKD